MKRHSLLPILMLVFCGCANFLTTTATSGTSFGMKREAVMRVVEKKGYKIVSPSYFNNIIIENKNQAKRLAKSFNENFKDLKLKRYSWCMRK